MIWTFLLLMFDVLFVVMVIKGLKGLLGNAEPGEIETYFIFAFGSLFVSEIFLWLPAEFDKGQIGSFVFNSVSFLIAVLIIIIERRFMKSLSSERVEEGAIIECLVVPTLVISKLVSIVITLINLYIPTGVLFFWLN